MWRNIYDKIIFFGPGFQEIMPRHVKYTLNTSCDVCWCIGGPTITKEKKKKSGVFFA